MIKTLISINNKIEGIGSVLMKSFLRVNGAKIGKNTFVSFSSRLFAKNLIIGNDVKILRNVKINAKNATIGNSSTLSENVFISGGNDFILGAKCYLGKKVKVNISEKVVIGDDVGIGENTVIWTHGYFPPVDEGYPIVYRPVEIKNNVWVSTNIIILPGVTLDSNVIVGAGSVVTKSAEANSIIAGNPAKRIKNVQDILVKKPFTSVMENVFSNYKEFTLINKTVNCLQYNFGKNKLFVFDKYDSNLIPEIAENSFIICKNSIDYSFRNRKFYWFDFDSRERCERKTKEVEQLLFIFSCWGIRLTVYYG